MKRKQVISGTILFVLALVSICTAKVITVIPSKDNTLFQDNQGSLSNGTGVGLFVGHNKSGTFIRRALLAFNLSNHIPPGSTIHSVNLTLHLSRTASDPQPVWLHRVLADWGEGLSEAQKGGDHLRSISPSVESNIVNVCHGTGQHSKITTDFLPEAVLVKCMQPCGIRNGGISTSTVFNARTL